MQCVDRVTGKMRRGNLINGYLIKGFLLEFLGIIMGLW